MQVKIKQNRNKAVFLTVCKNRMRLKHVFFLLCLNEKILFAFINSIFLLLSLVFFLLIRFASASVIREKKADPQFSIQTKPHRNNKKRFVFIRLKIDLISSLYKYLNWLKLISLANEVDTVKREGRQKTSPKIWMICLF